MFTLQKKRVLFISSISVLLVLLYGSTASALGIKFRPKICSSEEIDPNQAGWIIENQYPTNSATITIPEPAGSSTGVPSLVTAIMHGAEGRKTQRQRTYYNSKKKKRKTSIEFVRCFK
ncbi:hypothetical protein GAMM_170065 [Gammaproteobacteria bacterium]